MSLDKKKPLICAVGMFQATHYIQLETLLNIFKKHDIDYISTTYKKSKILKFFDILFFLIMKNKHYDVIHIQSHSYYNIITTILSLLASKIFSKKIIIMYYGGDGGKFFSNAPKFFNYIFSKADQLIVAGPYMKNVFANINIQTKIIPHILDTDKWSYKERTKPGHNLLWVRNLEEEYNPFMLIDLYEELKNLDSRYTLNIIGEGALFDTIKNLIKDRNLGDIYLSGRVSHDKLNEYFKAADIFLNTTNVDNQPVSVLESMLCGSVVVSTNAGGVPDIVSHRHTGMLSNCGDVDAMAKNILKLINDEFLYTQISKNSRKFVMDKFSEIPIYNDWKLVYNEIGFELD